MNLRELFEIVASRARLVILVTIISLALGTALVVSRGPTYEAETRVLLTQPQTALAGGDGLLTQQKLNLLAFNYANIVGAPEFVASALEATPYDASDVDVSGDSVINTSVISILAASDSDEAAVAAAEEVAAELIRFIEAAERDRPRGERTGVTVIERPEASLESATAVFSVLAIVVTGAALAVVVALALGRRED